VALDASEVRLRLRSASDHGKDGAADDGLDGAADDGLDKARRSRLGVRSPGRSCFAAARPEREAVLAELCDKSVGREHAGTVLNDEAAQDRIALDEGYAWDASYLCHCHRQGAGIVDELHELRTQPAADVMNIKRHEVRQNGIRAGMIAFDDTGLIFVHPCRTLLAPAMSRLHADAVAGVGYICVTGGCVPAGSGLGWLIREA